jgi:hypothetical protein
MIGYFKASRSHHPPVLRTLRNACPTVPENSRAGEGRGGIGRRRSVVEVELSNVNGEVARLREMKNGIALTTKGGRDIECQWSEGSNVEWGEFRWRDGLLRECVTRSNV